MKSYRLKKDLPGIIAGAIFKPDKNGNIHFQGIETFRVAGCVACPWDWPEWFVSRLTDWFEPIDEEWKPSEIGEVYFSINQFLEVDQREFASFVGDRIRIDNYNYFKTEESAEKAIPLVREALKKAKSNV